MNTRSMAGWINFAGLIMVLLGGINFFQGLIAVIEDDYYVVTPFRMGVYQDQAFVEAP